tara:strand:+ start:835 stop:2184 length:1350 start_codon:yes stop_codon:yes gene_type:complete
MDKMDKETSKASPSSAQDALDSMRAEAKKAGATAYRYKTELVEARNELAKLREISKELEQKAVADLEKNPVLPVASPAKMKTRHYGMLISFFLMIIGPAAISAYYLYARAADQYASTVGFTVRSEDISSSIDLLSGLGGSLTGGGGSTRDTDILYEFMRSPDLVRKVDDKLDLHNLYSRFRDTDPIFSFDPDGTIEDLTQYWQRMVRVSYDTSAKLLELRVLAFDPDEAKAIADSIIDESTQMINGLTDIARADATRYASEDLDVAVERLKKAREALTAFRLANQIVDVEADIQGQMGLLNTLQAQQAEALIELDLLADSVREGDPRLDQAQRRLAVINSRVEEERRKFGAGGIGPGGADYATTISEFERLTVDREFAEMAYAAALSSFDAAKAEASRQSRYLAAYAKPTRAEKPEYPQRETILAIVLLFSFLIWVVSSLIYYSLRERR